MGETLHLLIRSSGAEAYEVVATESWSGQKVSGAFIPPYSPRQITTLQKKLSNLDSSDQELRSAGTRLFAALCGLPPTGKNATLVSTPVQALLQNVIQRTLKRRGTVALMLTFGPDCEDFVRYPWELLHNGQHFLLTSGLFTLTRALLRADDPGGCELPVHPPFRVLYIGSSPSDCAPLETERSFAAMEQGLAPLIETGQVFLDRLEPPTFSQLVRYLNSYGGAGTFDDSDTKLPCYVLHFDGHGTYGRLCPQEGCEVVNPPDARLCEECQTSLVRVKAQTYLCFCDEEGRNAFIDTQSLRDLLLSSDVRLAVFSACETATLTGNADTRQQRTAVDATLATALVTSQVSAVVAMPFSLQDDLSPTFMLHFYEALAEERTLEEALSRARQAMLSGHQKSWFIPVLYRHVADEEDGPVSLLAVGDTVDDDMHPLAHLSPPVSFIGREAELVALDNLLAAAVSGARTSQYAGRPVRRAFYHHIAFTGPAGIGKSALALEAIGRNRDKFSGGIVGISLQNGKSFGDALMDIIHQLHISVRNIASTDAKHRARLIQGNLRSLASRELPCLLFLDSFEEVQSRAELETWLQFLCSLPKEVVVMVTSRFNPEHLMVVGGPECRWYEYRVDKMTYADLHDLFTELAFSSGLDQRIRLADPQQQALLKDICVLLDGFPLGAELIFGTTRTIGGQIYTPEAATRSLEEIRDELRRNPLAGILAVLEVAYNHLSPAARVLLSYVAAFRLPFTSEQIALLISPALPASPGYEDQSAAVLALNWRAARDELVQASFMQFDSHAYAIHPQTRHFALNCLPPAEKCRVHRVVASYYAHLPEPALDEWVEAFEHLEAAGELADLFEAVTLSMRAATALANRGCDLQLQVLLQRAVHLATALPDPLFLARALLKLAVSLRHTGSLAAAEQALQRGLALLSCTEHPEDVAGYHYEYALLYAETAAFDQARASIQQAAALFAAHHMPLEQARTEIVQGIIARDTAKFELASGHFTTALEYFSSAAHAPDRAFALAQRGSLYTLRGQFTQAMHDYEEAQRLFLDKKCSRQRFWVNIDKAWVYLQQGKWDLADTLAREAYAFFAECHLPRGEAYASFMLGSILVRKQEYHAALRYYLDASTLAQSVSDRVLLALTWYARAELAVKQGAYQEARTCYEQLHTLAQECRALHLVAYALWGLGDCSRIFEQLPIAERYYTEALQLFTQLDLPWQQGRILYQLGQLYEELARHREALHSWEEALSVLQPLQPDLASGIQRKLHALTSTHHLD